MLTGNLREVALEVVHDVAHTLARQPPGDPHLAGGSAGRALLHARLAADDPTQRQAALRCLRHAVGALRTSGGRSSLFSGAAGVGWVLTHLRGDLLDERDRGVALDRSLLRLAGRRPWPGHVDLVTGLAGLGVYALERGGSGGRLLAETVARLSETATRADAAAWWWTPRARIASQWGERFPDGCVDLGVAHGVPGPIAVLAAACRSEIARDIAAPLLRDAVDWLLRDDVQGDHLPYWWSPDRPVDPARTAWCYGEPGVAAVLLIAARSLGEVRWEEAALVLAGRALARPAAETGVVDAGLCHGTAGLGLAFARLHHATGDAGLRAASEHWFTRTLELRRPGCGVAGFVAAGDRGPDADAALLTGAAGVALALHAAATSHPPDWDRMLLLSLADAA